MAVLVDAGRVSVPATLDVLPEIDRRIMKGLRQHMAPQRPDRPLRRKGRPPRALPDDAPENPF